MLSRLLDLFWSLLAIAVALFLEEDDAKEIFSHSGDGGSDGQR